MEDKVFSGKPERIKKLQFYLMDKEPLLFLFLVNSKFVFDEEGVLNIGGQRTYAGVTFNGEQVVFYYSEKIFDLSTEELLFLITHEALHIFKKHTSKIFEQFKNQLMFNIAADGIINEQIKQMNFIGMKPKMIEGGIELPKEFKEEFKDLKEKAYTVPRFYRWLEKKAEENSKENSGDELKEGDFFKDLDTGDYGVVKNGKAEIFENKKEMIEEINGNKVGNKEETKNLNEIKNKIKVMKASDAAKGNISNNGVKVEVIGELDKHFEIKDEIEAAQENSFVDRIYKQAEKMIEENESIQNARKQAGIEKGFSLMKAVEELLKSQINWKRELKQKINIFLSDRSSKKAIKDSYITYLYNPKSRYGIISKHKLKTKINQKPIIILAVDTSGSVFFDKYEKKVFFTEIDSIAKEVESKNGSIYIMMWDTSIHGDLVKYNIGDWKKFNLEGGGGTTPKVVFDWLEKNKQKGKRTSLLRLNNDSSIFIENKKKQPLLVFVTDGYFFDKVNEDIIGDYMYDKKSLVFLTRTKKYIEDGLRTIIYE